MKYISTRGRAPHLSFDDVVLTGLGRDGGLYVPAVWPQVDMATWHRWRGLGYADLGAEVMRLFVGDSMTHDDLAAIWHAAISRFRHSAVAPLKQLDHNLFLLELFHGPTLAFKDYALQILGGLFAHILAQRQERITVVGATSGDTGSAAIEACRDREGVDIFMLFPKGRVSPVQQRQMTTVTSGNVHCIAIEGTFDDCQDLVKAMFNDHSFCDSVHLSAVNSINWARILSQTVYTIWAGLHLGAPQRSFRVAVPTGNFGNVFSAYVAQRMGLPVVHFGVASNANDILARYFQSNDMSMSDVVPTLSPSMDIQISSNFERYLFDCMGDDGHGLADIMRNFRAQGKMTLPHDLWQKSRESFSGYALDDQATLATIREWYEQSGEVLDPHTAIGVAQAASWQDRDVPTVAMATAHPAKFPDAIAQAIGQHVPLPSFLSDLLTREERLTLLPNDLATVQSHIRHHTTGNHS